MTGDPAYAMQAAIHAKLAGSSELVTAMGGAGQIRDSVPNRPIYPLVRIGEDQTIGASHGCGDSYEFFATIHIFAQQISNLGARPLAKRIGDAVVASLTAGDLSPYGFHVTDWELENTRHYMESDGVTAHGVVVLRFLIDPWQEGDGGGVSADSVLWTADDTELTAAAA